MDKSGPFDRIKMKEKLEVVGSFHGMRRKMAAVVFQLMAIVEEMDS